MESRLADMSDLDKPPANPHIPWKQLVTSFQEGGLTPAQYASFGESPLLSPSSCLPAELR
jgi:hypothetical protein